MDDPPQVYYQFNNTNQQNASIIPHKQILDENLIFGGNDSLKQFKYHLFPHSHNEITIRIENIGDKFDHPDKEREVPTVDMIDLAAKIFYNSNCGSVLLDMINVDEVTLSGN